MIYATLFLPQQEHFAAWAPGEPAALDEATHEFAAHARQALYGPHQSVKSSPRWQSCELKLIAKSMIQEHGMIAKNMKAKIPNENVS
jgi:hypothetical protein